MPVVNEIWSAKTTLVKILRIDGKKVIVRACNENGSFKTLPNVAASLKEFNNTPGGYTIYKGES